MGCCSSSPSKPEKLSQAPLLPATSQLSHSLIPKDDSPATPSQSPATTPPTSAPSPPAILLVPGDDSASAVGLLLCGAGESGKTTITRQLKLRFIRGGISDTERRSFLETIRGNLVDTMKLLLEWTRANDVQIDTDSTEWANLIDSLTAFNCEFTIELWEALEGLWEDGGIKEAFSHRDETIIADHMDYFFEKLADLRDDSYLPNDDDVLRARIRSIGIDQITLNFQGTAIRIYDVGGQFSERNKWNRLEQEVQGIIYCVSFADFDKPMFEDVSLPRIRDSLAIFADLTHRTRFTELPFFFIANKFDGFSEKVRRTDCFVRSFPEYAGDPHDPVQCAEYLTQLFIERANPPLAQRPIIIYQQNALDGEAVTQNATAICREVSVRRSTT